MRTWETPQCNSMAPSPEESHPTKVPLDPHPLGSKSRADGNQQYYEDPNKQMLRETGVGSGIEVMQKNLSIDREYERIRNQLKAEFEQIDINQDGTINIDEIIKFLNKRTNGKVDTKIAMDLYNQIDLDGNGVQLDEFVQAYFEQQREVKETILALEEELKTAQSNRD